MTKLKGIPIGDRFKLSIDGKRVTPDEAKELAKLNIPQRIKRRKSTKTRPAKRGEVV